VGSPNCSSPSGISGRGPRHPSSDRSRPIFEDRVRPPSGARRFLKSPGAEVSCAISEHCWLRGSGGRHLLRPRGSPIGPVDVSGREGLRYASPGDAAAGEEVAARQGAACSRRRAPRIAVTWLRKRRIASTSRAFSPLPGNWIASLGFFAAFLGAARGQTPGKIWSFR